MSLATVHEQSVSAVVARYLKSKGVERVYGLSGGHIMPIWMRLDAEGIRIIDVRDERAAYLAREATDVAVERDRLGINLLGERNDPIAQVPAMPCAFADPRRRITRAVLEVRTGGPAIGFQPVSATMATRSPGFTPCAISRKAISRASARSWRRPIAPSRRRRRRRGRRGAPACPPSAARQRRPRTAAPALADTTASVQHPEGRGRGSMMGQHMPGVFGTVTSISGTTITVTSKSFGRRFY